MDEYVAGTIKLAWSLSERDAGIADIRRELTPSEVRALCDRLEDVLTSALPQLVTVLVDGEDQPGVQVLFDLGGKEIEIDDGPVNGLLDELREEAE